jgi:N-acetylglucosaminyldiphosphoundecaprenol N-acetyl-beta-D-mannosaminyltransferase
LKGKKPDTINIGGIEILNLTRSEHIDFLEDHIKKNIPANIGYVNQHVFLLAQKNETLKKLLESFYLIPDGMGIYLASKILFGKKGFKEKIISTDLWYQLLERSSENYFKLSFLGGSEVAGKSLMRLLLKTYDKIKIKDIITNPEFFNSKNKYNFNLQKADILFVGLGTPMQEKWIVNCAGNKNIPVKIAVGSAIEFFSNHIKRAPAFLTILGFEWLFRLVKEPRRLWKRYIIGIPVFLYKIIEIKFSK